MPVVKKRNQQTETRLLLESDEPVELPPAEIDDNAVLVQFEKFKPYIPELLEALEASGAEREALLEVPASAPGLLAREQGGAALIRRDDPVLVGSHCCCVLLRVYERCCRAPAARRGRRSAFTPAPPAGE